MGLGKIALDQNGRRRDVTLGGDLLPYSDVITRVWYGDINEVHFSQPTSSVQARNTPHRFAAEVAHD